MDITTFFSVQKLEASVSLTLSDFRADFHKILLVRRGEGCLKVDKMTFDVGSYRLFLFSREQVFTAVDATVEGYLLQFDDAFWLKTPVSANNCKELLFTRSREEVLFNLGKVDFNKLQAMLGLAYADVQELPYANQPDVLAAFLKIIVIRIANIYRLIKADSGAFDTKLYHYFLTLVQEEGLRWHKVEDYAEKMNISPRKLAQICKKQGAQAKELISAHLLSEAKKSLQFSDKPIKEIALDLHFSTPYHFSNFFKKSMQISPDGYRKSFVEIGI